MSDKFETANSYTAEEMLALWTECAAQIAVAGQSYTIGNRTYTAADSSKVLEQIQFWEQRVNAQSPLATNVVKFGRR